MYIEKKESYLLLVTNILFHLFLIVYFAYHTFGGKYGILSHKNVNETLLKQKNRLNTIKYEVEKQKNKIDRLKNSNLDLDLLEEELKKSVGIADKNEIILLTDDLKKI